MSEEGKGSTPSEAQITLQQLSANTAIKILPPKPKNDFIGTKLFKEKGDKKGSLDDSKNNKDEPEFNLSVLNRDYMNVQPTEKPHILEKKKILNCKILKAQSEKNCVRKNVLPKAGVKINRLIQSASSSKDNLFNLAGKKVLSFEDSSCGPRPKNVNSPKVTCSPYIVHKSKLVKDNGKETKNSAHMQEGCSWSQLLNSIEPDELDDESPYTSFNDCDPNLEGNNSSESMEDSDFEENGALLPEGTSLTSVLDKPQGFTIKSLPARKPQSENVTLKKIQPQTKTLVFNNNGGACLTQGTASNFSPKTSSAVVNPLSKLSSQKSPLTTSNSSISTVRPTIKIAKRGIDTLNHSKFDASKIRPTTSNAEGKAIRVVKPTNVVKFINTTSLPQRLGGDRVSSTTRDENREENTSDSTVSTTSTDKLMEAEGLLGKFGDRRNLFSENTRIFPVSKFYKKRVSRQKLLDEPECLTLSSDEDDKHDGVDGSRLGCPLFEESDEDFLDQGREIGEDTDEGCNSNGKYAMLQCRTVRIGSYRVAPIEKVIINDKGVSMIVHPADNSLDPVPLLISMKAMQRVLVHFGDSLPVIFINATPSFANEVRMSLKMLDKNGPYFDPVSPVETEKRITILPECLDEEAKATIKSLFGQSNIQLFQEISQKDANEILVRSSPKNAEEIGEKVTKENPPAEPPKPVARPQPQDFSYLRDEIYTILIWPPPPNKEGITITTDDYCCLEQEQFLNDVIIDFYLKYVLLTKLTEEDRYKTHIFSSYFYQRLTLKPNKTRRPNSSEDDPKLSPAEKRHARVKGWTKNVDIFDKDYIIIPINEHSHWFLAIICFPGLKGPVNMKDSKPVTGISERKTYSKCAPKPATTSTKMEFMQIGSTTITAIKPALIGDMQPSPKVAAVVPSQIPKPPLNPVPCDLQGLEEDWSDRDEAEGDEDELLSDGEVSDTNSINEPNTASKPDAASGGPQSEDEPKLDKKEDISIKQPSILIFDSLAGSSRSRIVATLRDYLQVEYKRKRGEERSFNKDTIKGQVPKVPQQNNFSDCGLYLLQYAESFFENRITDYKWPIKTLKEWFPEVRVAKKRQEIQNLIIKLMEEQNPHLIPKLPQLHFDLETPRKPIPNLVPFLPHNRELLTLAAKMPPTGQVGNRPVQTVRPIPSNMKLDLEQQARMYNRDLISGPHSARLIPRSHLQDSEPFYDSEFMDDEEFDDEEFNEDEEEDYEEYGDMEMDEIDRERMRECDEEMTDEDEEDFDCDEDSMDHSQAGQQQQPEQKQQQVRGGYSTDEVKKMLQGRHVTMECVTTFKRPLGDEEQDKNKRSKESN